MTGPFQVGRQVFEVNPVVYADGLISRLPRWARRRVKDFFTYSVDFLPLAAATAATRVVGIQADSYFMIAAANRAVTDPAAEQTFFGGNGQGAPLTVEITDTGSGRVLMDAPVHIDNLMGSGQRPGVWEYPKLISRAGALQTRVTNLDAAQAFNVRISYVGFKIFADMESEDVRFV